jgi:hypothetical protein
MTSLENKDPELTVKLGLEVASTVTVELVAETVIGRLAKEIVNDEVVEAVKWFEPCAMEAEIAQLPELPVAVTTPLEASTEQPEDEVE